MYRNRTTDKWHFDVEGDNSDISSARSATRRTYKSKSLGQRRWWIKVALFTSFGQ
jgi:hypothetical protein